MSDRSDEDLEKQTSQADPPEEISDDEDLLDEIETSIGSLEDLKTPTETKDWVRALELISEIQDSINRAHAYISDKVE